MNTLIITTQEGNFTVSLKSNSEQVRRLLEEDVVKVFFDSVSAIPVRIGDYCTVFGRKYYINTTPIEKKLSSNLFQYELSFESSIYDLSKVSFLDVDATGVHISHEFYLIGNVNVFKVLLEKNLERVFGIDIWALINVDVATDKVLNLSFSENNCLQALQTICAEFGCEYELEEIGSEKIIRLKTQAGGFQPIIFKYGKNNGLYDIKRTISSSNNLTSRLYAFGSSKNIGPNYRSYSTRLKLPGIVSGTPDIAVLYDETELVGSYYRVFGSTTAMNVRLQIKLTGSTLWQDYGDTVSGEFFNANYLSYPTIINAAAVRLKAWDVIGKYVFSNGTHSGWDVTVNGESYIDNNAAIAKYGVIERTIIFDDIFPQRIGTVTALGDSPRKFIDSGMFDLNAKNEDGDSLYWLGIDPKISFRTGNLAGYEFIIADYDTDTKAFTIQKYIDERALEFPNPDSAAFQIQEGDEYVILDIAFPDSYVEDAENRLLTRAQEWLEKYSNEQVLYELNLDEKFVKDEQLGFGVGDSIGIQDTDLDILEQIKIVEVRRNLVNEYKYALRLSNSVYKPKQRKNTQQANSGLPQLKQSVTSQSDWEQTDSLEPSYIKNKPDLSLIADKHMSFNINHKMTEIIQHGLDKNPAVSIVDENGELCLADVTYIEEDKSVMVSFVDYFTGKIIFN
ncbi:MAG: hypothetical protein Q8J88_00890 [Bacteroidales bacterium]|nr:hypothetical protein [Bacteroidales bacterium]